MKKIAAVTLMLFVLAASTPSNAATLKITPLDTKGCCTL